MGNSWAFSNIDHLSVNFVRNDQRLLPLDLIIKNFQTLICINFIGRIKMAKKKIFFGIKLEMCFIILLITNYFWSVDLTKIKGPGPRIEQSQAWASPVQTYELKLIKIIP